MTLFEQIEEDLNNLIDLDLEVEPYPMPDWMILEDDYEPQDFNKYAIRPLRFE